METENFKLLKTENKGIVIRVLAVIVPFFCVLVILISLNMAFNTLSSEKEALAFLISTPYLYTAILLILTSIIIIKVINKVEDKISLAVVIISITATTVLYIYSLTLN